MWSRNIQCEDGEERWGIASRMKDLLGLYVIRSGLGNGFGVWTDVNVEAARDIGAGV